MEGEESATFFLIPLVGALLFPFLVLVSSIDEEGGTDDADFISEGEFCELSSSIYFTIK
jgi:hypothetical protein